MKYEIVVDSKDKSLKIMVDGVEFKGDFSFSKYSYTDTNDKVVSRVSVGCSEMKDKDTYVSTYLSFNENSADSVAISTVTTSKDSSAKSISKAVADKIGQTNLENIVKAKLNK